MVVKSRRTGARSWTRSIFAFLWIVVGGLSSLYLFTLFTDPAALSAYNVQLSAGGVAPAVAIPPGKGPLSAAQATALKDSLSALSKQMAEINTRLETIEEPADPASDATSPPEPEAPPPVAEAEPTQEPVEMVAVEETEIVETPESPAPASPAPEPAQTAAAEPEPAPRAELVLPTPAPVVVDAPVIADLPPVVTSPVEVEPAPESTMAAEATPAPVPTAPAELASIDPVMLPPAANDGSTRYGIEIGTVSKRDALRPLWRELLTKHAALVAGLQPRRVLAPDKRWRLIAGPFANAQDAEGACTLFKKADRPCAATVFAGDAL